MKLKHIFKNHFINPACQRVASLGLSCSFRGIRVAAYEKPSRSNDMKCLGHAVGKRLWIFITLGIVVGLDGACWRSHGAGTADDNVRLTSAAGTVEISQAGATNWLAANTNMTLRAGDSLRTGERSRAVLLWSDRAVATISETTLIEILPPEEPKAQSGLHIWRGLISFFHRDAPGRFRVHTRSAMAGIEGTEFVVNVDAATEATTLSLIDGRVTFSNQQGALTLTNLQQAVAELGQPPRRTAGFTVNHILQWCFYYPGVLDLEELPLNEAERQSLADSIAAYRTGDLLDALKKYPVNRRPVSPAEHVYHAALLLAVGLAEQSEAALALMNPAITDARTARLANALRLLIAVVKREPDTKASDEASTQTATEALALSYYEQSRAIRDTSLRQALTAASRATELSPNFSFAWARVADLEFSFGRTRAARQAIERSLALSPRNAQALALQGFLLAAENKSRAAIKSFDQALAIDPALGNAWLGRGLCKIRLTTDFFSLPTDENLLEGKSFHHLKGASSQSAIRNPQSAIEDLLIAAAVEPQRSLLRSYLGKAWTLNHRDAAQARKELELAIQLDPVDPTPWLYRALLNERENRLNEAIRDLDRSQELNDNRRVYQSKLRLDQDRAVGSANLARLYADMGLQSVALREAGKAVDADYANFSPHLFLANSYTEELRFSGSDLRLETAAATEYLTAALLGPATPSAFSPQVSQQLYGPMLEKDRLGLVSRTDYLGRGAWRQTASQYGTLGRSSYSVGVDYESDNGEWANQDFERESFALAFKHQVSDKGSLFAQYQKTKLSGGDLTSQYDESGVNPGIRFVEKQHPVVMAGYHHEWSPASRTLALFAAARASQSTVDPFQTVRMIERTDGAVDTAFYFASGGTGVYDTEIHYRGIELQQVVEQPRLRSIIGGRFQFGEVDTASSITNVAFTVADQFFDSLPLLFESERRFERAAAYVYERWEAFNSFFVIGGVTMDYLRAPRNFRSTPPDNRAETTTRLLPKVGFIWKADPSTTIRGAFTRSQGGITFEQSLQIEPSSVAGFNQLFRSIIPDSVSGASTAARFETFALALDREWGARTFLNAEVSLLRSSVDQSLGVIEFNNGSGPAVGRIMERIRYQEPAAELRIHQLLGNDWSLNGGYRLTFSRWSSKFPRVPSDADDFDNPNNELFAIEPSTTREALLHRINASLQYQHPTGWFGRTEAGWFDQDNGADDSDLSDDSFVQWHFWLGYRHPRRHFEAMAGILNLLDQDYRLNPLNPASAMPRDRTLAFSLKLNF